MTVESEHQGSYFICNLGTLSSLKVYCSLTNLLYFKFNEMTRRSLTGSSTSVVGHATSILLLVRLFSIMIWKIRTLMNARFPSLFSPFEGLNLGRNPHWYSAIPRFKDQMLRNISFRSRNKSTKISILLVKFSSFKANQ